MALQEMYLMVTLWDTTKVSMGYMYVMYMQLGLYDLTSPVNTDMLDYKIG